MFWVFLQNAIRFSTVFLYGSVGETITEKSGNLNLGIPGIMCVGTIGGLIGESLYLNSLTDISQINGFWVIVIPMIMAILFAGLMGLLYCFLTVTLRCNQNVTGLAITTFGIGFLSFVGQRINVTNFSTASKYFVKTFSGAENMGGFGKVFFSYGCMVYLAIAIALITALVLKRTRTGLNLRAVGENPATADAAGISVTKYKYVATIIGSAIAGLGGLFYIMDYLGGSIEYTVDIYGWMAVALVIFSVWKTDWGILGSFLFGALYTAPNFLTASFAAKEIIKMIPYVVTIIILIATSIRNKKETQPPASLGMSYFREER